MNGRADRKVKILGELVDVEALEREIKEYLDYESAYLLALPDSRRGTRVVLVVGEDFNRSSGLLEKLNEGRVGFLRINAIESVGQLPRTEMGKVDVTALRELLS